MKATLDKIWSRPQLVSALRYVAWRDSRGAPWAEYVAPGLWACPAGEAAPDPGKSARAFQRRITKHYGPPPDARWNYRRLYVSEAYRARAKERFPRNWRYVTDYCGVTFIDAAERDTLDEQ